MAHTIIETQKAEIKIERSTFVATIYPTKSLDDAHAFLKMHNQEYVDATHNCYAYILGLKKDIQHYSDAGEPGGTAGKPILNSLLRADLTGVLAVVTRYYGGIKLGVKGLIDAYTSAMELVISKASIIAAMDYRVVRVDCEYGVCDLIKHIVKSIEGRERRIDYAEQVSMVFEIPHHKEDEFYENINGYRAQGRLSYQIEE